MPTRLLAILLSLFVVVAGLGGACVMWRAAEIGERVGPVAERIFEAPTLVAVGTGGAYENRARLGPVTAVGLGADIVLVDAGRGITAALRDASIPVIQPTTVLLTSLMPENVLGLADLIVTGQLEDRTRPLRVIGPTGTTALVAGLQAGYAVGVDAKTRALGLAPSGAAVEATDVAAGWSGTAGDLRIVAGDLPGGPLPGLAWRLEGGGKQIVVGGAGWGSDSLVEFASGADLLVSDAAYIPAPDELEDAGVIADPIRLEREAAILTPMLSVGKLAARARVPALMLIRLQPPPFFEIQVRSIVSQSYDGRILVPEDGDAFTP